MKPGDRVYRKGGRLFGAGCGTIIRRSSTFPGEYKVEYDNGDSGIVHPRDLKPLLKRKGVVAK